MNGGRDSVETLLFKLEVHHQDWLAYLCSDEYDYNSDDLDFSTWLSNEVEVYLEAQKESAKQQPTQWVFFNWWGVDVGTTKEVYDNVVKWLYSNIELYDESKHDIIVTDFAWFKWKQSALQGDTFEAYKIRKEAMCYDY